jgi:broad specificity phosphatase PhoE
MSVIPLTKLYLLRHGEVAVAYHRIFGGRIDMDLSPRGHEQARHLAEMLRPIQFDVLYASPMKRVQQTIAPLLRQHRGEPVVLPGLREVDFGAWTGLNWEEVHAKFGVRAADWLHQLEEAAIPEAESGAVFRARVEPCLRQILRDHAGQTVAVACHGGVIRMLLSILLEMPLRHMANFEIDYASMTWVNHAPRRSEVQLLNFTPWRDRHPPAAESLPMAASSEPPAPLKN